MDDSNHDMVNMLAQQSGIVFNPLIQNTNHNYQQLEHQMGRIVNFFGAPQTLIQPITHIQAVRVVKKLGVVNKEGVPNNQVQQHVIPQLFEQHIPKVVEGGLRRNGRYMVLVNMNQDAYQVVKRVQQNNFGGKNNIASMVERILVQNGLNVGLRRPNFVCALSGYVLRTEIQETRKFLNLLSSQVILVSPMSITLIDTKQKSVIWLLMKI